MQKEKQNIGLSNNEEFLLFLLFRFTFTFIYDMLDMMDVVTSFNCTKYIYLVVVRFL